MGICSGRTARESWDCERREWLSEPVHLGKGMKFLRLYLPLQQRTDPVGRVLGGFARAVS
jgi:hypothetical protein